MMRMVIWGFGVQRNKDINKLWIGGISKGV